MRLIGLVLALSLALAPLAAEAQQKGKVYRIGLLSIATVTYTDAFRQGLRDLGYVEGRTIVIEYREAQSYEGLPKLAKELVRLKPDVTVSAGVWKPPPRRSACGLECWKHGIGARSTPYLERSSARTPALCSWVATLYSRAGGNESLNWRRSCSFRRCTGGGSSWKWVVSCLMERAFPICIGVPPPMWTRSSRAPSPLTFPSSSQPSSNW